MKKNKKNREKVAVVYSIVSTIRFLLLCMLTALLVFTFVVRKETVKGSSMYPMLKEGQNVFINVAASYTTNIHRFDVVVVKNYRTDNLWVKRVIGLPGDVVEYKNDILYINGKKTEEPFLDKAYVKRIKQERDLLNFTSDFKSEKLGSDEYLLVGDNRVDSFDSRFSQVGAFKRDQIIAKGLFIVTPIKEMRYVGNGG